MKTLKINLLAYNTIFVGEITKKADLLHTFYVKKIEKLDEFISTNAVPYKYFYKAFGYWILCSLQRCKENKNHYGILTRKLINFSKKLWKRIRSLAQKRSNNSKRNLTLRVSINAFCSSFFLYCKRSPCFSLEIFSLIRNIIF